VKIKKDYLQTKIHKFAIFWLPPMLWAALIFTFSAMAVSKSSEIYWQDFVVKKTAHFIEYAVLSFWLYRALLAEGVGKVRSGVYAVVLSIIFAISDEVHQSYTPGREPRIRDVVIDTIGAGFSIYTIWKLLPKMPKRLKLLAEKLQVM